jgi:hypothetical protein
LAWMGAHDRSPGTLKDSTGDAMLRATGPP